MMADRRVFVALAADLFRRLRYPIFAVLGVFVFGVAGYYGLGQGRVSLIDSIYMTSITLTTVGYGEIFPLGSAGRTFTIILMWAGMGVMIYATAIVTSFFVEINLVQLVREQRMLKRIAELHNHYIVCGASETALHIIRELHDTKKPFVVIELDERKGERLQTLFKDILVLQGDAIEESVLQEANIGEATGLFAALGDDGRNMLLTVVARYVNPRIKIVSECRDNNLTEKFYRAGANYVVNPMFIGGMRMASEMLRPQVVTFLDRMLRGQEAVRVEEATVQAGSPLEGKTLAKAAIAERMGLTPIALQPASGAPVFNPSPQERLMAGTTIIVIGTPEQVERLRTYCQGDISS